MPAAHLSLGPGNVGDGSLDRDHPLQVEGADVADGADSDLGVRVLHYLLDRRPALPNDPPDQVVVGQNFERHFRRLANVSSFLFHHLKEKKIIKFEIY